MAAIKPIFAAVELSGGPTWTDIRIIFADRLALERTARVRGWDIEKTPQLASAFMAWAALRRLKLYAEEFDDFLDRVIDVQLDDTKEPEEADPEDPTRPGRSIEP